MDDVLSYRRGGLVDGHAGRGGGQHVHELGDHGDGGGHPVGDELHHPGQVGVLQGQAGQVPVHGDEFAQGSVLAAETFGSLGVVRRVGLARGRQHRRPVGQRHGLDGTFRAAMAACARPQIVAVLAWFTCRYRAQGSCWLWLPQAKA
jgi:hypothetical protein